MPAQVLRSAAVGLEFIASAVTSAIESQQVELMPANVKIRIAYTLSLCQAERGKGLTSCDSVHQMTNCQKAVDC